MNLKIGYKVLITREFYEWYHTDSDLNPPAGRLDLLKIGEVARIVDPAQHQKLLKFSVEDNERLILTCDDRAFSIIPVDVLEPMRQAYLKRGKK